MTLLRRLRVFHPISMCDVVAPRRESVFTHPIHISHELCDFLGVARGTMLSRAEVFKQICAYAKQHGLLDKTSILRDTTLFNLLRIPHERSLWILGLPYCLKSHYLRVAPAVPAPGSININYE